ncbi:Deoxyguanosinetriphosphate triphosphohydrolase [Arsenophonus endosymbiont of Bemisia tabaci Q2]|nr:Deoxyguanosinetriphosphate triphosphohydrolase [Arsenophonus endosymbiont of Bemisia tabaci Q2]
MRPPLRAGFQHYLTLNFSTKSKAKDQCQINFLQLTNESNKDLLRRQLRIDLCQFEGNAQGLRMIHELLKLNLTYAQIGSILKYTKGAYQLDKIPKDFDYLTKNRAIIGQKIVLSKSCIVD